MKVIRKEDKMEMIQLEKENFKVDSTGWEQFTNRQGIIYLENSLKDIWEFVAGVDEKLIGQQLFTWNAAMREIERAGKRMPSDEEWDTLVHSGGRLKRKALQFNLQSLLAGSRFFKSSFDDCTSHGYFWSLSENGCLIWSRRLDAGSSTVSRLSYGQSCGFSVRCLKD